MLLQHRNKALEESYGFDIFGLTDDFVEKIWYPSCSQPQTLTDITQRRGRYILRANRDNNPAIKFVRCDVAHTRIRDMHPDPILSHEQDQLPGADYQCDQANMFFMAYMQEEESIAKVQANADDYADMTVVLDAVKVEAGKLQFISSWKNWTTSMLVREQDKPELGYQAVASFKQGDCMEVMPIAGGKLAQYLAKAA